MRGFADGFLPQAAQEMSSDAQKQGTNPDLISPAGSLFKFTARFLYINF